MTSNAALLAATAPDQKSRSGLLYLGALLAVAFWGGNFVAVKFAFVYVDPIFLTSLRFGLIALLVPFAGWPSGVPLRVLLAYSAASCMGQYLLSTVAMSLGLSAGIAAFVMQAQVFFSIGLAYLFSNEGLRKSTVAGALISFVGLAFVLVTGKANVSVIGFFVCLAAAALWGVAGLLVRVNNIKNIFQLQSAAAAVAFPVALGCSFLLEPRQYDAARIGTEPILFGATLLYTTVLSFLLAQILWSRAIRVIGLSIVSPLSLLVPVVGIALASFVLGERYTQSLLVSIGLVLVGLAIHFVPILYAQLSPAAPAQPAANPKPVDVIESPANEASGTR